MHIIPEVASPSPRHPRPCLILSLLYLQTSLVPGKCQEFGYIHQVLTRDSLYFFKQLSWRYSSHTIIFTHWKCTIQWFLACAQTELLKHQHPLAVSVPIGVPTVIFLR